MIQLSTRSFKTNNAMVHRYHSFSAGWSPDGRRVLAGEGASPWPECAQVADVNGDSRIKKKSLSTSYS